MAREIRIATKSPANHEPKNLSPPNTKHTKRGEFKSKARKRRGRTRTQYTRVNSSDSKAQRAQGGYSLLSQSNPLQSFNNPWTKSTQTRRTEGGRRRGGGLEKQRVHEQITKAAINLTQVKGYLYPRDRSDRYAGPVRPVG